MKDRGKDAVIEEAKKLSVIIDDYWSKPSVEVIEHWLEQFHASIRLSLVVELRHILSRSYFSLEMVREFLGSLVTTPNLVGPDPAAFWRKANLFAAQQGGTSQAELLEVFGGLLRSQCGIRLSHCGSANGPVIYIDDVLFSGNRIVNDLRQWIPDHAPASCELHAIFMGIHSGGAYYAQKQLAQMAQKAQKRLTTHLWRALAFNNYSNAGGAADVYRLRGLPADEATTRYVQSVSGNSPALMRSDNEVNSSGYFSSEENRTLLEQTFWATGLHIRDIAINLKETHRPLGYTSKNSNNKLGFGSLVVTYRNCPNNCPLAYWVGDPWHPLFPRKTN